MKRVRPYVQFIPALLAVLAGAVLPIQAGVNSQLRGVLGTPVRAAFSSFLVGTIILGIIVLAQRGDVPAGAALLRTPWWMWLGGAFGAFYIFAVIVSVPRLGAGFAFSLIVAGQMLVSLVVDRFGLFGIAVTPLNPARLAGAALLVGGVLLLRR